MVNTNNYVKKFFIFGVTIAALFACIAFSSCAQQSEKSESTTDGYFKISSSLPAIPLKEVGLGELTKQQNVVVNPDEGETGNALRYTVTSSEYYSSEDGTKSVHIGHYNNVDNISLEGFTEIKSFQSNISYTNYRMAESELMALANSKVVDGYYVKYQKVNDTAYIVERAVFPDGDNFSIISLIFKCEDVCIPNTDIHIQIPIIKDAKDFPMPYRDNSVAYSYADKFELPIISYYSVNRSLSDCLFDYASAYNVDASEYDYNGMHFVVAKELNVDVDGQICNVFTLFTSEKGKTYAIELRELCNYKTYSFGAILNGLHFAEK